MIQEFNLPQVVSGQDVVKYRKATKDDVCCGECKYTIERWWSKRLECTATYRSQAVGKNMTCGQGQKKEVSK